MARNIVVEEITQTPVEEREVEIVERKGLGHPDSVADGLAESVSRALSRWYLEKYGIILHHNTDETQIVGGQASPRFGGGVVLEPIYILLVGRATTQVNGERVPYRTIALKAAREYLEKNFRYLDIDEDVMLDCRIGQGSVDLRGLYDTKQGLSNDTSFGVGYAPMSETERIVYRTERLLIEEGRKRYREIGEDIKVMGFRDGDVINLTVALAMVGRHIPDPDHYMSVKEEIREFIADNAVRLTDREVKVSLNTGDIPEKNTYYLTVTGLSMENGDDGSVGRGNRVNGLITPYRPMSMEASAGKNPVTHVGKLYNVISFKIAEDIAKAGEGDIREVHVRIVSQIGKPVDQPQVASIQIIPAEGVNLSGRMSEFREIANSWLEALRFPPEGGNVSRVTRMILNGEISVF
jgi:S-adenosylmethionine synthetase